MQSKIFLYQIYFLLLTASSHVITDTDLEAKLKEHRPLTAVQPQYPRRAQERGTEGFAIISFTITEQGNTENPVVVDSKCGDMYGSIDNMRDCSTFDNQSLRAAKKLRYRPAEFNGSPIKVDNVIYRFRYLMDDNREVEPVLNIPSRSQYAIERWISDKKIDEAEKKSLELLSSYEDVNFYLGKIYALKNQDALAIKHLNRFLDIDYDRSKHTIRSTLEISAVAIISEKLYGVGDYKSIIALAPKINNSMIVMGRSDTQNKNANYLIDISYFYLGSSYLMEGNFSKGKEALLFVKERTSDKNILNIVNNYLLQIE
jgi:TonB family protein